MTNTEYLGVCFKLKSKQHSEFQDGGRLGEGLCDHLRCGGTYGISLRRSVFGVSARGFSGDDCRRLCPLTEWDHVVEIIPGSKPTGCKVYPLSPVEQKELDIFLEENLETGQIRPSKSPMLSSVFFIKKKDGSL